MNPWMEFNIPDTRKRRGRERALFYYGSYLMLCCGRRMKETEGLVLLINESCGAENTAHLSQCQWSQLPRVTFYRCIM